MHKEGPPSVCSAALFLFAKLFYQAARALRRAARSLATA